MPTKDNLLKLLNLGNADQFESANQSQFANFTLRNEVFEHPRFTHVVNEIARLHRRGIEANDAQGMLLLAQTGSGKSTAFEYYERHFPRIETKEQTIIPVLRVTTPESPTVKMLAEAILFSMGDPAASKGTSTTKTMRIVHLIKECKVELLLIDEFQHFNDGRHTSESEHVSDWLKNLITCVNIPVILAGLPRAITVVNNNPQLRRRFGAPLLMRPFGFKTDEEQKELRTLLKTIQKKLPCGCISLFDANVARSFYYATHGIFDYIVKIIDDAVSRGGTGPYGKIATNDFASAFKRTVWLDAPDELNPFSGMKTFRHLTGPGEPFEILDDFEIFKGRLVQRKRPNFSKSKKEKK